jgi:putative membrane protein
MGAIAALYHFKIIEINIPWLPVSVLDTAVAFYVGFKNNQAYDRMWEARKIWGAIINDSRTWGMMIDSYISNLFAEKNRAKKKFIVLKRNSSIVILLGSMHIEVNY